MFSNFLASLRGRFAHTAPNRLNQRHSPFRNRARLSLERLEDRWTPANFTVTNLNDTGPGSLSAAIAQGNNSHDASSTIQIKVQGVLALQTQLAALQKNITIIGPGHANFEVEGNNTFRIFATVVNTTSSIQGITIVDGNSQNGGGVYNQATSLTLTDVWLTNNKATNDGGGIYNDQGATLVCNACLIGNNNATISGGGIDNNQGAVTLALGTVVTLNGAYAGGGISSGGTNASLTIQDNSSITYNAATFSGGGIFNSATLNMTGGSVSNNTAANNGGGIYNASGTASFTNVAMDNNSAVNKGGAFEISAGTINYTGGEITGNTASIGTAGYIISGFGTFNSNNVTITGTIVYGS